MYNGPFFGTAGVYEPENLIANHPVRTDSITVAKGQKLKRGTVLGRIKAAKVFVQSKTKNEAGEDVTDGSEVPMRILASDIDASETDRPAMAYRAGTFLRSGIILDKSHDIDEITYDLEIRSIYLQD